MSARAPKDTKKQGSPDQRVRSNGSDSGHQDLAERDILDLLSAAEKQATTCRDPLVKHMIKCAHTLLVRERQS